VCTIGLTKTDILLRVQLSHIGHQYVSTKVVDAVISAESKVTNIGAIINDKWTWWHWRGAWWPCSSRTVSQVIIWY